VIDWLCFYLVGDVVNVEVGVDEVWLGLGWLVG